MTKGERKEAFFRILVLIVSGIMLGLWGYLVIILSIINFLITLFTARRNKDIAEFCEYWNTTYYEFYRYLTFMSNKRPFPFSELKRMSRFT